MSDKLDYIFKKGPAFCLSPMVGVTSLPFRLLCRNHGADTVCTEMLSSQAIIRLNKKTVEMATVLEKEKPAGIQLMGPDAQTLVAAIKKLNELASSGITSPAYYDLNLGCPSRNIIKSESGSYLLQNPAQVQQIVSACAAASDVPLTVKTRSGYSSKNIIEIAKAVEKGGASAITIHARTAAQGYSGKADWSDIKAAKQALAIRVIGNGDITYPQDAISALSFSGADGVMIGRGAIKDPKIFEKSKSLLKQGLGKTGDDGKRQGGVVAGTRAKQAGAVDGGANQSGEDAGLNIGAISSLFEEYAAIASVHGIEDALNARTVASELTAGLIGGAKIRKQINGCRSIAQLRQLLFGLQTRT